RLAGGARGRRRAPGLVRPQPAHRPEGRALYMTERDPGTGSRYAGRLLILRADASRAGGTGHFMRTLALAQAWLDGGGDARWLVSEAPDALVERITREGIDVQWVDAPPGSLEDAAVLRGALAGSADGSA